MANKQTYLHSPKTVVRIFIVQSILWYLSAIKLKHRSEISAVQDLHVRRMYVSRNTIILKSERNLKKNEPALRKKFHLLKFYRVFQDEALGREEGKVHPH